MEAEANGVSSTDSKSSSRVAPSSDSTMCLTTEKGTVVEDLSKHCSNSSTYLEIRRKRGIKRK